MPKISNIEGNLLKEWPLSEFYILDVEYTSCVNSLENDWHKKTMERDNRNRSCFSHLKTSLTDPFNSSTR